MCEAMEAIRARKLAAEGLTRACAERGNPLARAYLAALAEPVPEDLRRLVEEADRRLGH